MNLASYLIFCAVIGLYKSFSEAGCNGGRGQSNTVLLEVHPMEIYEGNDVTFYCKIGLKEGESLRGKVFNLGIKGSPDHLIISNCHNFKPPPMYSDLRIIGKGCETTTGYVEDKGQNSKIEWRVRNMTYKYSGKEWFCSSEGFTDCTNPDASKFKIKLNKPLSGMIMVGDDFVRSSVPIQALEGTPFLAMCSGVGNALGYMKYKWKYSSEPSEPSDDSFQKTSSSSSFLRFASINRHDAGHYRCFVNNAVGQARSNMKLQVFYPPTSIFLTTQSTGNTTLNISCKAQDTNFRNYLDLSLNFDKKDGTVIVWKQIRGDTITHFLENKMVYSGEVFCEGKMTFPTYQKTMASNVYLLNSDGNNPGFLTSQMGGTVMYIIIAAVCLLILIVLIGIFTSIRRRLPRKHKAYDVNNPEVNKDPRPEAEQEDEEEEDDDDDDPSGLNVIPLAKRISKMNSIKAEYISSGHSRVSQIKREHEEV